MKPTEQADIIIIRGAPGSGKSQTAKSLAQFFPKGVRMEVDAIRQMVISVDWQNQQEHINILQLSIGLVDNFLNLGFSPVIVVDTFSGNKINRYLDILQEIDNNIRIKVFGLFTTDDELKRRLDLRASEQFRDFPVCKKLNDDVLKIKCGSEYQIDTTGRLAMETAKIIYSEIHK